MNRFNSISKIDEDGSFYRQIVFSSPIIRLGSKNGKEAKIGHKNENAEMNAKSRAKSKVRDYVCTNKELKLFVTYTLDKKAVVSRYDEKVIYKQISSWLKNNTLRHGFKYVLVPEKHKDGAWHFHGFVNEDIVWKYGTSSVKRINRVKDRNRVISYITSYITKGNEKFNGRYYLHSQNLLSPDKLYDNVNFSQVQSAYKRELFNGIEMKIIDF